MSIMTTNKTLVSPARIPLLPNTSVYAVVRIARVNKVYKSYKSMNVERFFIILKVTT